MRLGNSFISCVSCVSHVCPVHLSRCNGSAISQTNDKRRCWLFCQRWQIHRSYIQFTRIIRFDFVFGAEKHSPAIFIQIVCYLKPELHCRLHVTFISYNKLNNYHSLRPWLSIIVLAFRECLKLGTLLRLQKYCTFICERLVLLAAVAICFAQTVAYMKVWQASGFGALWHGECSFRMQRKFEHARTRHETRATAAVADGRERI